MRANVAIDFYPSSFSTQSPKLMGLQSANEGLLSGFILHANVDALFAHTRTAEEFTSFTQAAAARSLSVHRIFAGDNAALARVGALLHPFPGFGPLAWIRRFADERAYSLLGITHTTATAAVMDSIGNLCIAPIHPWDAVVCTSTAVRQTYEAVLGHWHDYLASRLGAVRFSQPLLPVIPLGVNTATYATTSESLEVRKRWRESNGIGEKDIVVLWVGRFNHAAKAHPIPAYLALEAVAHRVKSRLFYVQAGWFASPDAEKAFQDAARRFAPAVRHAFVDGRHAEVRAQVWHAADIFLSLSDNIQETFGLTPIEAMAAGLPAVVTDWDGYRDTVRDGIDGIRIPTSMPRKGAGGEIAQAFNAGSISYDAYCGITAETASFDFQRCVEALISLANDADLRRRMGESGRQRAIEVFDWSRIVASYHDLLEELERIRTTAPAETHKPNQPPFPLRADPYDIFGSYPTSTLSPDSVLHPIPFAAAVSLDAAAEHPLNRFVLGWLGGIDQLRTLLASIHASPGARLRSLADGTDALPESVLRAVGWLAKMGFIRISN
jgi:glycosyltransferase involved in cell wall biosynthesis